MKSLKSIVCSALDEQEFPGKPKVSVTKLSNDAYGIQITVEAQYADDIDEIALYDEIADSEYADYEVNIDIVEEEQEPDKFEYTHSLSNAEEDEDFFNESNKSEEELVVEADELRIFDPTEEEGEDSSEFSDDDEYDDFDEFDDAVLGDINNDYDVTWKDVEDFEKEYGRD